MIAVRFWGGLGNQFFQYSFGRALAIKTGEDLRFYMLDKEKTPATLSITEFDADISFLQPETLKKIYFCYGNNLMVRAERKLTSLFPFIHPGIMIEKGPGYSEIGEPYNKYFDGYWQSYRYFNHIADRLKEELTLKRSVKLPCSWFEEINSCQSVAVHVRRGDYLSGRSRSVYHQCDERYYSNAVDLIKEKVKDPVFFVFSDDIDWVKRNFIFMPDSTRYVIHEMDKPDCIDNVLMRQCRHFIIANSTFSWWAAFLGGNNEKTVIAPEKWYLNKTDFLISDLIPSTWIMM